jgi:predicted phosphodiesterase
VRIAVFSDVHANLEALQATLSRLEAENIDRYVSLGDIVGYGANPNECIEVVRTICQVSLIGNHDFAALGRLDISYFNPYAKKSVVWTGSMLKEDNRSYLESLQVSSVDEALDLRYVHSTPYKPEEWNYIFTVYDARVNFNFFLEKICFIGHSHQPVFILMNRKGEIFVHSSAKLKIEEGYRFIINVGSIGQPRDGDPTSSCVIYDTEAAQVQLLRIPYDIELTQTKMHDADIHPFLVERLAYGR